MLRSVLAQSSKNYSITVAYATLPIIGLSFPLPLPLFTVHCVRSPTDSPVYAAAWSPDSNQVIYTAASTLVVKSLQPSVKPTQWKAHDALILAVDWSASNGLVISAGEDRKYKVSIGAFVFH